MDIGFGLSRLHRSLRTDTDQFLQKLIDEGFDYFDTAPIYGDGYSDSLLAKVLATNTEKKILVATKLGLYPKSGYARSKYGCFSNRLVSKLRRKGEYFYRNVSLEVSKYQLDLSLSRLGLSHLHYLWVHDPDEKFFLNYALIKWIEDLKSSGVVSEWGVTGDLPFLERQLAKISLDFQLNIQTSFTPGMPLITDRYVVQSVYGVFKSQANPLDRFRLIKDSGWNNLRLIFSSNNIENIIETKRIAGTV